MGDDVTPEEAELGNKVDQLKNALARHMDQGAEQLARTIAQLMNSAEELGYVVEVDHGPDGEYTTFSVWAQTPIGATQEYQVERGEQDWEVSLA